MKASSILRLSCFALFSAAIITGCESVSHLAQNARDFVLGRYHATPAQVRVADQRATHYYKHLSTAQKTELKQKNVRYLAVKTNDPSPAQIAEIKKSIKSSPAAASRYGGSGASSADAWKKPIHCIMLWDVETEKVVGNECYAVYNFPPSGTIAKFETYSAEYVDVGG